MSSSIKRELEIHPRPQPGFLLMVQMHMFAHVLINNLEVIQSL